MKIKNPRVKYFLEEWQELLEELARALEIEHKPPIKLTGGLYRQIEQLDNIEKRA